MKTRMICLAAVMFASAPLSVLAAGCSTYDYAELKDMSLAELKKASDDIAVEKFLALDVRLSQQDGQDLCDSEKAKVDRMIAKREAETPPTPADPAPQ